MEIIEEANVSKNPISIEECESDVIMNQKYVEDSIQHLEIVPVHESVDELQCDNICYETNFPNNSFYITFDLKFL